MAGKYGIADCTLSLEDGPGGTARNIHGFVTGGLEVEEVAESQETTALGDSWKEHTPTGLKETSPITVMLLWDTTATTGTHAVFLDVDDGPEDDGRELVAVFGDSKTYTVDVRLVRKKVMANNGSVQMIEAELLPTGAGVWS